MYRLPINFLIGFLIGSFLSMAYYDGMVAKEYKARIDALNGTVKKVNQALQNERTQNQILLKYIEDKKKYDARIYKSI